MNFKTFLIENRLLLERQLFYNDNTVKIIKKLYNDYKIKIDEYYKDKIKNLSNKEKEKCDKEKDNYINQFNIWFGVKIENNKPIFRRKGTLYNWLTNIYLSDKDKRKESKNKNTIFKDNFKLFDDNIRQKYNQEEDWITKSDTDMDDPKQDKNFYEIDISNDTNLKNNIKSWLDKMIDNLKNNKIFKDIDRMINDENENEITNKENEEKLKMKTIGTVLLKILSDGWELREISEPYKNKTREDVIQACKYEGTEMQNCIEKDHTKRILNGEEIIYSIRDKNNNPKCTMAVKNQDGKETVVELKGKQNKEPLDEYLDYVCEALNYLKKINRFEVIDPIQLKYIQGETKSIEYSEGKYKIIVYDNIPKNDIEKYVTTLSNNVVVLSINCGNNRKRKLYTKKYLKREYNINTDIDSNDETNLMYYGCFKNNVLLFIIIVLVEFVNGKYFYKIAVPNNTDNSLNALNEKNINTFLLCLTSLKTAHLIDGIYNFKNNQFINILYKNNFILNYDEDNKEFQFISLQEIIKNHVKNEYTNKETKICVKEVSDIYKLSKSGRGLLFSQLLGEDKYKIIVDKDKYFFDNSNYVYIKYYIFYYNDKAVLVSEANTREKDSSIKGKLLEDISGDLMKKGLLDSFNYLIEKGIFEDIHYSIHAECLK